MMRRLFLDTLRRDNELFERYDDTKEGMVTLIADGNNVEGLEVSVIFKKTNEAMLVYISSYDLPNLAEYWVDGALDCNHLNREELVTYQIDEDGDVCASATVLYTSCGVEAEFSPEQILAYANELALSVDQSYPILQSVKER